MKEKIKKGKKAQITLYIVIAILIIAIGFAIFLISEKIKTEKQKTIEIENIKTMIHHCLEKTTRESVKAIAMMGFYRDIPKEAVFIYRTSYYYDAVNTLVPTIGIAETELEKFLSDFVNECFVLDMPKYKVYLLEKCKINASISEKIVVNFECPTKIKFDKEEAIIKDFSFEMNSSSKRLLELSKDIVEQYIKDRPLLCVTCFNKIIEGKNVSLKVSPFYNIADENQTWFALKADEDQLILVWAVK